MPGQPTDTALPSHGEDRHDDCMVHGAAEIRGYLQRLLEARSVLVGHAGNAAAAQVTALLQVGDASLLIDVPRAQDALHAWLGSPRLHFQGCIDRISVGFACGPAWLDQHDGQPALGLPFPVRLLYQQRREYLRIVPTGALRCRVPESTAPDAPAWLEATIRDIGGGGLAMLVPADGRGPSVGDLLEGCEIDLPQSGTLTANLLVRHLVERTGRAGGLQVGCEFVDLPRAARDKLLRYVMQLERERVSRRRALE